MPKANAIVTQQPRRRDALPALRLIEAQQISVADWANDERELAEMSRVGDLPGAKLVLARIASAPAPSIDGDLRRALTEPVNKPDALAACVLATASLGGPRSRAETNAYLRDIVQTTVEVGATAADIQLVHRWLRTRAGSPGRPARLPTFEFRPAPGVWDELLNEARWRIRPVVDAIDRRAVAVRRARHLLGDWPKVEAEHAARQRETRALEAAAADRIAACRRKIRVMARETDRTDQGENWHVRTARTKKMLEEQRAAMPAEARARLDIVKRRYDPKN